MSLRSILPANWNWSSPPNLDADFLTAYRKLLFGQYKTLPSTPINQAAKEEADSVIGMKNDEIEWEDLYRLELAIIKLEPSEALRTRAWILRNEYKEMASAEEYKDYISSKQPETNGAQDDLLRAELIHLQEELNWRYVVTWVLEAYRSLILRRLVIWTVFIIIIALTLTSSPLILAYFSTWTGINLPFLESIILPGLIGGLISTVRRIQSAKFGKNADIDLSDLLQGNASIYISPFLGGIFALVLFFLFTSGLAAGDLFPKVKTENLFVSGLEVLDFKEAAKLIIWCFLAGFAESLVPDRLQQLTTSASQKATDPKH